MSVRFAPSPTGAFHIGNFRTAWISHAWARALRVPWVVRFEDIDTPRVVPGSQQAQLDEMKQLGLAPDEILVQSARRDRHWEFFEKARKDGRIYPCHCSRKYVLASLASAPHGQEALYSGACRTGVSEPAKNPTIAWRFRNEDSSGRNDFIVARTDTAHGSESFVPAYHWACAIDDWDEGHRLLVRAQDLAQATTLQRAIQSQLPGAFTRPFPAVFHSSLVVANDGSRLEKRSRGVTWPELLKNGYSAQRLVDLFQRSFELDPSAFLNEKIWGEVRPTISLEDLGIKI